MSTATEVIRLGPADHGRRMTMQEFIEADEIEGYRYELARGVVEVVEVANDDHGEIVWALLLAIAEYDRDHPGVIRRAGGGAEFRLWLPVMASGRNPDVAVALSNTRKDDRGRRPPRLVMEVVSPGAEARERDLRTKREEYLAFGLDEYWIVDPIERRITVLTRAGDSWIEHPFGAEQFAEGLVLPGLRVGVNALFEQRLDGDDEGP